MINKTSSLCIVLFILICGLARTQTQLDGYYADLSQKEKVKPIDFCFKINSPTPDVSMEILFGTCASGGISEANTTLPPGTVGGSNPVDFFVLHSSQAWNVFFTENRQQAEWIIVVNTPCTLNFFLLGGVAPGEGGSLEFFQGETKRGDIVAAGSSFTIIVPGQYTIKYIPAPEKSTVTADVTFTFQPGWNLLHLPIVLYSDQRRENGNDNWDALLNLRPMTLSGRTYVKGGEIRCGEAFWVFYKNGYIAGNTLIVKGYIPLARDWPARRTGWNFTNTEQVSANIYEWAGRYQSPATIDSKKGYWIRVP